MGRLSTRQSSCPAWVWTYEEGSAVMGESGMKWFLILGATVLGLLASLHGSALLVATLAGTAAPSAGETIRAVFTRWTNPVAAYAQPLPGVWVYLVWALMLIVVALIVFGITTRRWRRRRKSASQRRQSLSIKDLSVLRVRAARRRASRILSRSTDGQDVSPELLTSPLGRVDGVELHLQHEDAVLALAPQRSGKSSAIVVPRVIDAPGPVLVTTTKGDVVLTTAVCRSSRHAPEKPAPSKLARLRGRSPRPHATGEVSAFDLRDVTGWQEKAKFDPVADCQDPEEAIARGKALGSASQPSGGSGNSAWFQARAGEVLGYYLHAAAVKPGGGSMRDVVRWAADFTDSEPQRVLQASSTVSEAGWADKLRARTQGRAGETVDSLAMTLSGILAPLDSPRVLAALCPPPGENFDVARFLDGANTLYIVSEAGEEALAPLLTMFTDYIMRTAQRVSQTRPGGRLWPPFSPILDEVTNIAPLPHLDQFMSDAGGRGICPVVVVQSRSQLRHRWGREQAEAIRGNATAQYYLPGIVEEDLQQDLSRAVGTYEVTRTTTSSGSGSGGQSVSTSSTWEDRMRPAEVRGIPDQQALFFYRNLRAGLVNLPPWWERPDAKWIKDCEHIAENLTGRSAEALRSRRDTPSPEPVEEGAGK